METSLKLFVGTLGKRWMKIAFILGLFIVPLFGLLDYVVLTANGKLEFLTTFWIMRGLVTAQILIQYFMISHMDPSGRWTFIHSNAISLSLGFIIAQMTVQMGGFVSGYYAGLVLLMTTINLILPWSFWGALTNGLLIFIVYITLNLAHGFTGPTYALVSNSFFLISTLAITSVISHSRFLLLTKEYMQKQRIHDLYEKNREKEAILHSELQMASTIQNGLLPDSKIETDLYSLRSYYRPAGQVSGDFYDITRINENQTAILISDASGHGVPAAFLSNMMKIGFSEAIRHHTSPRDILLSINHDLHSIIRTDDFITAFTLTLNNDGTGEICNAGHNSPIILNLETGELKEWSIRGHFIGIFSNNDISLDEKKIQLKPKDRVVFFTDGVYDALLPERPEDGPDIFLPLVAETIHLNTDRAMNHIIRRLEDEIGDKDAIDDISILLMDWKA